MFLSLDWLLTFTGCLLGFGDGIDTQFTGGVDDSLEHSNLPMNGCSGGYNSGPMAAMASGYRPDRKEKFSRKVFVGGLPPDIDEGKCAPVCMTRPVQLYYSGILLSIMCFSFMLYFVEEITTSFNRFGPVVVDWPHKAESKSYFPPKGKPFFL